MSDERKIRLGLAALSLALAVVGLALIWSVSWKVAVGAFLIGWGSQINALLRDGRTAA